MATQFRGVYLCVALSAGACASTPSPLAGDPASPRTAISSVERTASVELSKCPLGIPRARVRVDDTPRGADVTFTVDSADRVAELRMRVARAGEVNGPGAHAGLGHAGMHGQGYDHGLRLWSMVPTTTSVEATRDGAVLHIAANVTQQRAALLAQLHERIAIVTAKNCP